MTFPVVIGFVGPGIGSVGLGVVVQVEYLHDPVPNGLTLEDFFDRHTFAVSSVYAVQLVNHVFEFFDVCHDLIAKKQPFKSFFTELPLLQFRFIFEFEDALTFVIEFDLC